MHIQSTYDLLLHLAKQKLLKNIYTETYHLSFHLGFEGDGLKKLLKSGYATFKEIVTDYCMDQRDEYHLHIYDLVYKEDNSIEFHVRKSEDINFVDNLGIENYLDIKRFNEILSRQEKKPVSFASFDEFYENYEFAVDDLNVDDESPDIENIISIEKLDRWSFDDEDDDGDDESTSDSDIDYTLLKQDFYNYIKVALPKGEYGVFRVGEGGSAYYASSTFGNIICDDELRDVFEDENKYKID